MGNLCEKCSNSFKNDYQEVVIATPIYDISNTNIYYSQYQNPQYQNPQIQLQQPQVIYVNNVPQYIHPYPQYYYPYYDPGLQVANGILTGMLIDEILL